MWWVARMWISSTIGQKEIHSRDGLDYILHTGERSWTVVWRGVKVVPPTLTRESARRNIRARKSFRPGTQLSLF